MSESATESEFRYSLGTDELLSTAIVWATSAVTGQPAQELPPLEDVVSVDALDALYESIRRRGTAHGRVLSLSYCGVTIEVDGDETLYLHTEHVSG